MPKLPLFLVLILVSADSAMSARSSASSSSCTVFLYLTRFMLACSSCSDKSALVRTLRCGSQLVHGSGGSGDARPPPLVSCRPSSCSAASPPAPASSAGSSGPPPTGTAAPLAGARSSAASSPSRRGASVPTPAPAPAPSPGRGEESRDRCRFSSCFPFAQGGEQQKLQAATVSLCLLLDCGREVEKQCRHTQREQSPDRETLVSRALGLTLSRHGKYN